MVERMQRSLLYSAGEYWWIFIGNFCEFCHSFSYHTLVHHRGKKYLGLIPTQAWLVGGGLVHLTRPSAWYGMIWNGMIWHGMRWHGMVWYGMV